MVGPVTSHSEFLFWNKMPFINIKKQYIVLGMLVFVALFLFNSKPAFQCQFNPEVASFLPTIYGITPTYARLAQKADLTRLSQTLMLVKNFHWIVVEDSETKTNLVANLLKESGLKYTHLNAKTKKLKHSTASGVEQRNAALEWLRKHLEVSDDMRGVVYFMDDDNTYSLKIFDEMRKINRVGVWPVGIVGGMRVEMPIVTAGKVSGFNAVWKPFRPFPIDMAGFAINATLFLTRPDAKFSRKVQSGFQESEILKYFATLEDLEPLAENCTKVYVWHTRTQKPSILNPKKLKHPPKPDGHIEVDADLHAPHAPMSPQRRYSLKPMLMTSPTRRCAHTNDDCGDFGACAEDKDKRQIKWDLRGQEFSHRAYYTKKRKY